MKLTEEQVQEKRAKRATAKQVQKGKATALQASWARIKNERAVKELLKFMATEKERHLRVAIDGVGQDREGNLVRFEPHQRSTYLDRSAGIDEILAYIERKVKGS